MKLVKESLDEGKLNEFKFFEKPLEILKKFFDLQNKDAKNVDKVIQDVYKYQFKQNPWLLEKVRNYSTEQKIKLLYQVKKKLEQKEMSEI
jgi:hypothetical protein